MKIEDVSVADPAGIPYQWQQQRSNGDIRLKIGDPNATFVGEKTYVVSYTEPMQCHFWMSTTRSTGMQPGQQLAVWYPASHCICSGT